MFTSRRRVRCRKKRRLYRRPRQHGRSLSRDTSRRVVPDKNNNDLKHTRARADGRYRRTSSLCCEEVVLPIIPRSVLICMRASASCSIIINGRSESVPESVLLIAADAAAVACYTRRGSVCARARWKSCTVMMAVTCLVFFSLWFCFFFEKKNTHTHTNNSAVAARNQFLFKKKNKNTPNVLLFSICSVRRSIQTSLSLSLSRVIRDSRRPGPVYRSPNLSEIVS